MNRIDVLCILGAFLVLGQESGAQVMVTFRLNTSTVFANDITDESMVQVRGSIAPLTWDDATVDMGQMDGDYWSVAVTFDASQVGNTLEYKFYAEDWEDGDNKTLLLQQDVILEWAYFNNDYTPPYTPTSDIDLWFRVNMESNPFFDPETDEVGMRGQGVDDLSWATNLPLDREDESYYHSGQIMAPPESAGVQIHYKFVRGTGPDEWESIDNRTLTIPAQDSTIVWVWWNNEEPGPTQIDTGIVLFQADMSEMLANGWFNPQTEWISVRGSFEGWSNAEPMIPDPLDPTIYQWGYEIIDEHEAIQVWKFKAFPDENWIDSGWEFGANREFVFIGDMTLPPVGPNITPQGEPLRVDATVRFSVDMTEAICWYTGEPFPMIESVWLSGDDGPIGPLEWPTWEPEDTVSMVRLYDNGTHGDQVAGDEIWTIDLLMPAGTLGTIMYKYSVYYHGVENLNNGVAPMDNESGFAMNHVTVLDPNETFQELPTDIFGVWYGLDAMWLEINATGPTTAVISWGGLPMSSAYHFWRSTSPYFETSGNPWQTIDPPATSLEITEGIGNSSLNYFYVGRAVYFTLLSDPSNIVGEMDFEAEIP